MNNKFEDRLTNFWQSLISQRDFLFVIDIILVAIIIYYVLIFLHQIKAMRLLYIVVAVIIVNFLANALALQTVSFLMPGILIFTVVAVPVLLQRELRSLWIKDGDIKPKGAPDNSFNKTSFDQELIDGVRQLSEQAADVTLIVSAREIKQLNSDAIYFNAPLSSQLLTTILDKDSKLNRGATLISGGKIIATNVSLKTKQGQKVDLTQISEDEAIALSEQYKIIMIIISPKNGEVSLIAEAKVSTNIDAKTLKQVLVRYNQREDNA